MKKIKQILNSKLIMLIIIIILLITNIFIILKDVYREEEKTYSSIMKETEQIKINDDLGYNIYSVLGVENIYNKKESKKIKNQYEELKESMDYNIYAPLLIYNLYGTNKLGLNVYFTSKSNSYLEYTITVNDEKISDFTRVLKNDGKNNLTKKHEYQIIGFVNGYKNKLKLELKNFLGQVIATKEMIIDLTNVETGSQIFAKVEKGQSKEKLENGLYTILGNDSDDLIYMSMHDNEGVLRSYIPLINYRSHKILFKDEYMYFSISAQEIVKMSRFGEVVEVYELGKYNLHHDYAFTEDENIIILATDLTKDTKQDIIIKLDLDTKEVIELIDFQDMLKSYADTAKYIIEGGKKTLDWLHLNSIDYVDGDIYISSRETSSILKLSNIEKKPKLEYILAAEPLWKNTEFYDYLYKQKGEFKIHAGQHSVLYNEGEKAGVYYLTFFNNNYGKANSQPNQDYSDFGVNTYFSNDDVSSYYYVYEVNENKKTFTLVDSFEVDYSPIVSNVQNLQNGNVLVDSGTAGIYAEYDKNHKLIKKFTLKLNRSTLYRVLKYDYKGIWFN